MRPRRGQLTVRSTVQTKVDQLRVCDGVQERSECASVDRREDRVANVDQQVRLDTHVMRVYAE